MFWVVFMLNELWQIHECVQFLFAIEVIVNLRLVA